MLQASLPSQEPSQQVFHLDFSLPLIINAPGGQPTLTSRHCIPGNRDSHHWRVAHRATPCPACRHGAPDGIPCAADTSSPEPPVDRRRPAIRSYLSIAPRTEHRQTQRNQACWKAKTKGQWRAAKCRLKPSPASLHRKSHRQTARSGNRTRPGLLRKSTLIHRTPAHAPEPESCQRPEIIRCGP